VIRGQDHTAGHRHPIHAAPLALRHDDQQRFDQAHRHAGPEPDLSYHRVILLGIRPALLQIMPGKPATG
jgi:hypothetical protein